MIKLRQVQQSDFDEVLKIENECFIDPYKPEDLQYEFNVNPVNKIIIAEQEGKVVGFIDFLITFNSASIVQVAVTKEYRKLGIATMLLKEMETMFPKDGEDIVEFVTLEVRESNEAAKALYIKNGYEFVVVKPHYYKDGENAIYMLKRL